MRRVSSRMTQPSAPSTRSSHRKANRSCPGVPNRYSTRVSSTVIRPKSKATVVVVFCSTPATSSTCWEASVMAASVVSGSTSETAPTKGVFPTPNPPEMMIFAEIIVSERTDTFQDPLQYRPRQPLVRVGLFVHGHEPLGDEIGDQHPGDADRHHQAVGDLRDRDRALAD